MTEDQFLAAVDDGDLDAAIAKKDAQKQKRQEEKARRAADHQRRRDAGEEVDSDADAYEDVPEDPLALPDPDQDADAVVGGGGESEDAAGKKRAGVEMSPDAASAPMKKKKKTTGKKNFAGVDPDMVDALDPSSRAALRTMLLACFKAVEEAEVDDEEEEGYVIFLHLTSLFID